MMTADVLSGGGELGAKLRALDWTTTPLGAPRTWPQSLRAAASICLNSRFPIAIYWGPELALLYNEAWSPILGEKHPQALGKPGRAVWPEIWAEIGPLFEAVHHTGEGIWQQDQLLPMHRYGYTEECYFNFTFSPIRGDDGAVAGIFNAVIETTFRVLEERRAQLLRALGEHLTGAQSAQEVCTRAAEVLAANPADLPFCLLYLREAGAPTFKLAGTVGSDLATALRPPALDPANLAAGLWPAQLAAAGFLVTVDDLSGRFGVAPPRGIWPEPIERAVIVPIGAGRGGETAGLLVAGVSPRRALDEAYQSFFERLAQQVGAAIASADAYAAERRRAEAFAAIDEAKTAFFSNVSHEFRTPLTLMLGPLEDTLAGSLSLDKADRERLEVAYRNALRLLKLVNTLLDFSRIEAGRARAAYVPTDLATLTADLASVFRSAIERAGLELRIDCPPLPEAVYVDHDMWEQVVFNLLSNALKFTFEGAITIAIRPVGACVELEVRDTGTGIPADELPHLFERFHRVQGAKGRTFEGSGIGLALVQELARLHGGEARVASELGEGSTFTVSIPRGKTHLPPDRLTPRPAQSVRGTRGETFVQEALRWLPAPDGGGADHDGGLPVEAPTRPTMPSRILLADDNADMRDYVQRLLSPLYDVVAVADGVAALQAAHDETFDLVLSDVMMPGLDGFGLLRALRGDERTHDTPVVLLSARAGEEARVAGIEAGADDYLIKPFSARELLARVRAHLEIARVRRQAARRERDLRAEAQATRDQLAQVLAGISDLFMALDHDWRFVFVNEPLTRETHLPREQLLGQTIWARFPELVGTAFEGEARRAAATRTPAHFEYYSPIRKRWFESRVYPAASGLALFITDITARKQAELNTQFLLEVGELLVQQANGDELLAVLGERIGMYFSVDHCAFIEFAIVADRATVLHEWRADPAIVGFAPINSVSTFLSPEARRHLSAGQPIVIADAARDSRATANLAEHSALTSGAYLTMPMISDGALTFALILVAREPRTWDDDTVALVRELMTRIWARIERSRADEALRTSEAKLQSALDGGQLGAWSWDPQSNRVEADQRALELFDIAPASFSEDVAPIFSHIHPDDRDRVLAALARAQEPGGVYEAEFRVLRANGQVRWLTGAGRGRVGADGRVVHVYGVNADVSARKQAEADLREAQARRLAEERAYARRLQRLNAASLAINAAPARDELLARIAAEARELLDAPYGAVTLVPGGDWKRATLVAAPDGQDGAATWAMRIARLVYDERRPLRLGREELINDASRSDVPPEAQPDWPANDVLAVPLFGRDSTCLAVVQLLGREDEPFGATDEALLQQLAQIAAVALENRTLYEQERAARAEAEEASRLKDEFLATVSHELRTPLTALLGYAYLLQSRKRDEAYVARAIEKIVRSAQAQAQITEDLLDIARIVSGKLRIDPRPLNLITVVEAALETVRPAVEAKDLRLEVDLRPEASAIVGDANRLQQIVWNLLSNAAKFTPPGGKIAVRLEEEGQAARLSVSDTGQGISAAFLPYVFDRFRQADSSSYRPQSGLGLGLAIVRHLVELHGGTVEAASPGVGLGATFSVRLPSAKRGPGESAAPRGEIQFDQEVFPPVLRGLRVLVVDDQPDILEVLDEILTTCGMVVRTSTRARDALEELRTWRPDMLLSDIAMPNEDGYWLIRAVRALPPEAGGETPAVALTAYVRIEDRLRVLESGYQQYVPKPVEPAELREVLADVAGTRL